MRCGAEDFGRGRTLLQAEAQTDLRRTFAVFFRKLQNQRGLQKPPSAKGTPCLRLYAAALAEL